LFTEILKFCFEVSVIKKSFCTPTRSQNLQKISALYVIRSHLHTLPHTHTHTNTQAHTHTDTHITEKLHLHSFMSIIKELIMFKVRN